MIEKSLFLNLTSKVNPSNVKKEKITFEKKQFFDRSDMAWTHADKARHEAPDMLSPNAPLLQYAVIPRN